jgi:hypothetical protein
MNSDNLGSITDEDINLSLRLHCVHIGCNDHLVSESVDGWNFVWVATFPERESHCSPREREISYFPLLLHIIVDTGTTLLCVLLDDT